MAGDYQQYSNQAVAYKKKANELAAEEGTDPALVAEATQLSDQLVDVYRDLENLDSEIDECMKEQAQIVQALNIEEQRIKKNMLEIQELLDAKQKALDTAKAADRPDKAAITKLEEQQSQLKSLQTTCINDLAKIDSSKQLSKKIVEGKKSISAAKKEYADSFSKPDTVKFASPNEFLATENERRKEELGEAKGLFAKIGGFFSSMKSALSGVKQAIFGVRSSQDKVEKEISAHRAGMQEAKLSTIGATRSNDVSLQQDVVSNTKKNDSHHDEPSISPKMK